ncbi:Exodeoxyribonuclease 7 small subunit [bioreactor metagenome]|uniref:Exodeoxyribonuclease 7 small subunit n=1 Tax=bioreactor metagenome TaxID=1076179 RepID=A0A645HEZ5_9ZZZZ
MAKDKNKDKFNFEEKINRMQEIVALLDSGDKPLEEMINIYEEGMILANECRGFLEKAENKIIDITNKYLPSETDETDSDSYEDENYEENTDDM